MCPVFRFYVFFVGFELVVWVKILMIANVYIFIGFLSFLAQMVQKRLGRHRLKVERCPNDESRTSGIIDVSTTM